MNRLIAAVPVISRPCLRNLTTSQALFDKPGVKELRKKQLHFQVDDGVPIYLKGGPVDVFLFYSCLALTVVSLGMSLNGLYKLSQKGK